MTAAPLILTPCPASAGRLSLLSGTAGAVMDKVRDVIWKCWRGSVRGAVKWVPQRKEDVYRWLRAAEEWSALRSLPGEGRAVLDVLRTLITGYYNWRTGRLDPSYNSIAAKSRYRRSTVASALKMLAALGIIGWVRRCAGVTDRRGRYQLQQQSNAYYLIPPSGWRGYTGPDLDPPPPEPDTIGTPAHVPTMGETAAAAAAAGASMQTVVATLADGDPLARALARLGQSLIDRKPPDQ